MKIEIETLDGNALPTVFVLPSAYTRIASTVAPSTGLPIGLEKYLYDFLVPLLRLPCVVPANVNAAMEDAEVRSHISRPGTDFTPSTTFNLQVVIPCRAPDLTKAAIGQAARFAEDLNARVRLIDVHVVPYGVPLNRPTVTPQHLTRRLRELARESAVPVLAEVVFARDWEQGLRRSLPPGSLVLMPIKRSWWRSSDKRLAARLRKLGHQVVWIDSD